MTDPVAVTPESVAKAAKGLPAKLAGRASLCGAHQGGDANGLHARRRELKFGGVEPGPDADITIHDPAFASVVIKRGQIGVAEGYLSGQWTSSDLTAFLEIFCLNSNIIDALLANKPFMRFWFNVGHWLNSNTKRGSKRNIHAHYDLGNQFYEKWLDPTMTYSSALFEDDQTDLSTAQTQKYRALANKLDLTPDHSVLEIGCGWGGFAEFAARDIGCSVTGITISREQHDYACERIQKAGLNEKVDIRIQDYRETTGTFDRIASIEMFEAVGERYWPHFFQTMRDRLIDGGRAGIQVITIQDSMFNEYRRQPDFIQRYIFPGGMLPSPKTLETMSAKFGLDIERQRIFGLDYARTVAQWRDSFAKAWPDIVPLGFDEQFRRMWEFYLSYCEAGFKSGNIDVRQLVFRRV